MNRVCSCTCEREPDPAGVMMRFKRFITKRVIVVVMMITIVPLLRLGHCDYRITIHSPPVRHNRNLNSAPSCRTSTLDVLLT